jgi:hypothetical protein
MFIFLCDDSQYIIAGGNVKFGMKVELTLCQIPGMGKILFSTPERPDRLWGHPASFSTESRDSFPGSKGPRREAVNSPPTSTEVKNGGAIPSLHHTSSWLDVILRRKDIFASYR